MKMKKFINESFYNMCCLVMFITAVCLIFLLELKWPKNKSVYDVRILRSSLCIMTNNYAVYLSLLYCINLLLIWKDL